MFMNNKLPRFLLCALFLSFLTTASYVFYIRSHKAAADNQTASTSTQDKRTGKDADYSSGTIFDASAMTDSLETIIAAHSEISTSVSVVDITSGQQVNAGMSDTVFRGASTTKLITAAAYLHAVEQGVATLSQYINGDTATNLIRRMIENSDNDAWYALNEYLGYGVLETYGASIGMQDWTAYPNTITTADEANLLAQLYKGKLLTAAHAKLLLSYMANSDNNMIDAALPNSATTYHKYGTLEGELHDAAIIEYNGHTFILVIFTNDETDSFDGQTVNRIEYIASLARAVAELY